MATAAQAQLAVERVPAPHPIRPTLIPAKPVPPAAPAPVPVASSGYIWPITGNITTYFSGYHPGIDIDGLKIRHALAIPDYGYVVLHRVGQGWTGTVYALDAQKGTLLWKTQVDTHPSARIVGAPALYNDQPHR